MIYYFAHTHTFLSDYSNTIANIKTLQHTEEKNRKISNNRPVFLFKKEHLFR